MPAHREWPSKRAPMKLVGIERKHAGGVVRLSGWVERKPGAPPDELYFSFPERFAALVAADAEPFAATLLVAAMAESEALVIDAPVSQRLLRQFPRLQEVLASWYSDSLRIVPVQTAGHVGARRAPTGLTGSFFSLGVDSSHTMLRHEEDRPGRERITHLIHMTGIEAELRIGGDARVAPVIERLERVARHYGKTLVTGETNLRDWFGPGWGAFYHGSALAAAALSLGGGLDRVLIPSGVPLRGIMPRPTSPLHDHLWSSDDLEIAHDGEATDRARKLADTIVHHPEVLNALRVCNKYFGGLGNCGACHKCVRTMITLEILGVLRDSPVFPRELPRDFWRYFPQKPAGVLFEEENLRLARERGAAPWLIAGLERAVRLGNLEEQRQHEGTGRFVLGLLQLVWERGYGDALQRSRRKRRKRAAARSA